jgi:hypothetical protein
MAIRTTVDIPEPLHATLRRRSEQSGVSIRSLIIRALEQTYSRGKKPGYITGPLIPAEGQIGPDFPVDENPHDLVFS